MLSDCFNYISSDDLCSETPAVLTIELIAFNQCTFVLIMKTECHTTNEIVGKLLTILKR